jgi:hypothetical protein
MSPEAEESPDRPAHGLTLPPEPSSAAGHAAVAVFDRKLGEWFHGGDESWPDLSSTERRLIALELLAALQSAGLEVRTAEDAQWR